MNQIIMDSCILLHPNMVDECSPSKLAQDIPQGFALMRMKPLFMLGEKTTITCSAIIFNFYPLDKFYGHLK